MELIKARLSRLRTRARLNTNKVVHEVRYLSSTTAQEREQGSIMAEVFTGEALSFLKDNLTAKLSPLHPTGEQVAVFQFLMDSIDDESLVLMKTEGRMYSSRKPFVVKKYQSGDRFSTGGDLVASLKEMFVGKDVHLLTRWGVYEPFPHGFTVWGSVGIAMPQGIDFVTLPEKAKSPDDVRKYLDIEEQQGNFTQQVGIYNNGERIIIDTDGIYRGENVSLTNQYYLVGVFYGEGTQRNYWLYGCNREKYDKMCVSSRVKVKSTVTQKSPDDR